MFFRFRLNTTNKNQLAYDDVGEVVRFASHLAVDGMKINYKVKALKEIKSFINYLKEKQIKKFYIKRTYALGDILMLVPVIRYLRTLDFDPYLATQEKFFEILRLLDIKVISKRISEFLASLGNNYGIDLDGAVEQDHVNILIQKFHRIEIYLKALGVKKIPKVFDWSYDSNKFPLINTKENYIVFQGQGSGKTKSLPENSIKKILKLLNKDGFNVVYIGKKINTNGIDRKMTEFSFFDLSTPELFSLIEKSKCLICLDSAPFWISHFTKTPAIIIFGPTKGKQRMKFHPLYPEEAFIVQLNKEIKCKCCFERAIKCKFNYDCLKINPDKIYSLFKDKLWEFSKNNMREGTS